jgi:hypothetical protein
MKQMKTKGILLITLFIIGMTSCQKEELAEPGIHLEFKSVTSGFALKSTAANTLEFTDGQIILESVDFELESDTDSLEMEFEIESYITVDFATGETTPDLSSIAPIPGIYTELEIEVELWDESDQPAIVLNGIWSDEEGETHPVRFEFDEDQSFEVEIEGEFMMDENTIMIAQITFDPALWFSGILNDLFATATKDEDGIINISSDENTGIYDIVKERIDLVSEVEIEM